MVRRGSSRRHWERAPRVALKGGRPNPLPTHSPFHTPPSHTHTHTLTLSRACSHLSSRCPPSFHAIAPWHGAAAAGGFSLLPEFRRAPKGATLHPAFPPASRADFFIHGPIGRIEFPITGDSSEVEDGKRGGQSDSSTGVFTSTSYSLGSGFLESKVVE